MKGILERQWSRKSSDEVETIREFAYLSAWVSAGRGCEAAVTTRTRCGWVKFRDCGELMDGRRFLLMLIGVVYEIYVRPAILCGSEAWCLKESEIEFDKGQKDTW